MTLLNYLNLGGYIASGFLILLGIFLAFINPVLASINSKKEEPKSELVPIMLVPIMLVPIILLGTFYLFCGTWLYWSFDQLISCLIIIVGLMMHIVPAFTFTLNPLEKDFNFFGKDINNFWWRYGLVVVGLSLVICAL